MNLITGYCHYLLTAVPAPVFGLPDQVTKLSQRPLCVANAAYPVSNCFSGLLLTAQQAIADPLGFVLFSPACGHGPAQHEETSHLYACTLPEWGIAEIALFHKIILGDTGKNQSCIVKQPK